MKIGTFLDDAEIDYEDVDVETGITMNCGITECCGYDFGTEAFAKVKPKYCPMCGKKIMKIK